MLMRSTRNRRGTMLPLLAVCSFALFGFVALAVDLGMLMVARTECQNAADAAALIGARTLDNDVPSGTASSSYDNKRADAIAAATATVRENYLLRDKFTFSDAGVDRVEIGIYDYNTTAQMFQAIFHPPGVANPAAKIVNNGTERPWTACRVTVKGDQPTYFSRLFGVATMPMSARATAVHRPRDIALVLDFSASMMFGSIAHYPPGFGGSNGPVIGLLNPDERFPAFGHHARYNGRQQTNPTSTNQHPYRMTGTFTASSAEAFAPNNYTVEGTGGPPMVNDFYQSTNPNPAAIVNPDQLVSAFNIGGMPYSTAFNTQDLPFAIGPVGPVGDRYPRKGGVRFASAVSWDTASTTGTARNAAELLFPNGNSPNTPSQRTIPLGRPGIADQSTHIRGVDVNGVLTVGTGNNLRRVEGGTSWDRFYDDAWERFGYDLNIPTYISSNYTTVQIRPNELFQGYTLGPGYWGKTFFIWPPDPRFGPMPGVPRTPSNMPNVTAPNPARPSYDTSGRPMCDWRQRFFLKDDGTPFNPQTDNINQELFTASTSVSLNDGGAYTLNRHGRYRVNYAAVLAWLKTGPQVLPSNLRAGRILYYSQIPDDCANPANDDQRFWREYIDFVLGVMKNRSWYNPAYMLAGVETQAWGTQQLTATAQYQPTGNPQPPLNPRPYMNYRDVPNMPRAHFWFGPYSMMMFLTVRGSFAGSRSRNWIAGTVREAQCWQLKAAIQSALDDIRINHPNDQCGMCYFAHSNFRTPRVSMGQDWARLKAALFFPKNLPGGPDNGQFLTDVINEAPREVRPYNSNIDNVLEGNLPNGRGGTDPNHGFALAYNMLSSSSAIGAGGRRGATKIVIFETDGVPNSYQEWQFVAAGTNSRYNWVNSGAFINNGNSTVMNMAYEIVQQIVAPTTAAFPGFSLPNSPARVYPIAFGDLFASGSPFVPTALGFLQNVAFLGNTNSSPTTPLPPEQIITGPYQTRINNLRTSLERLLQSGVQVTLIE